MSLRAPPPWKTLRRTTHLSRRFLSVHEDVVELDNGLVLNDFCVVDSPPWVAVVCMTQGGRLVLVHQYRHGISKGSLELPAGVLDPGEEPLEAARRELLEETGYVSNCWRSLTQLATDPSRQTTLAHFFVATGAVKQQKQTLDESEAIDVQLLTLAECLDQVARGAMCHGLHVAALLLSERQGWLATRSAAEA